MRFNQHHIPIGDLRAETWLNLHFPDDFPVRVSTKGIFYGNYSEDLLEVDTSSYEANRVSLSRDGLFHLLPEALFVDENHLRDPKTKHKPFTPEKEHILNFFVPFDTEYFQIMLGFDKRVHEMEAGLVDMLVKYLYDVDIQEIQNPMIRETIPFLLQASEIRGDFWLISRLMTAITGFRTEIQPVSRCLTPLSDCGSEQSVIRVVFHIPELSNSEYALKYAEFEEFVDFMAEWFFPAELPFEYAIKEEGHPFVLDGSLTLDYNTYL